MATTRGYAKRDIQRAINLLRHAADRLVWQAAEYKDYKDYVDAVSAVTAGLVEYTTILEKLFELLP